MKAYFRFPKIVEFSDNRQLSNMYNEAGFHYTPLPQIKNCTYGGYFQSEKYFKDHAPIIADIFRHSYILRPPVEDRSPQCFIHVRRGDYLGLQDYHSVLSIEYYHHAIELMRSFGVNHFVVLSDDVTWACEHLGSIEGITIGSRSTVSAGGMDHMDDFGLGQDCDHAIIGPSSFSWWMAWLIRNPLKKVIYPKVWFGPKNAHLNTRDLTPPNWIAL